MGKFKDFSPSEIIKKCSGFQFDLYERYEIIPIKVTILSMDKKDWYIFYSHNNPSDVRYTTRSQLEIAMRKKHVTYGDIKRFLILLNGIKYREKTRLELINLGL